MKKFDAVEAVKKLKKQTKDRRFSSYRQRRSKLDLLKYELLQLRQHNATFTEIAFWLNFEKGIQIDRTTVSRWFKKNGG